MKFFSGFQFDDDSDDIGDECDTNVDEYVVISCYVWCVIDIK